MFVRTSGAQVPGRDQSNPARASEPGRPAFEALKRRVAEDLMGLGPDAASRGETPRDRRWYPHDPGPVDWFIDPFKRQVGDMYGAIVDAVTNLPVGAETAAAIQRWFPTSDKPLDTAAAGIWPDRKTGLLDIRPPDSYAPRVPVPNGSNIGEPFTFNDRDMHVYDYAFNIGTGRGPDGADARRHDAGLLGPPGDCQGRAQQRKIWARGDIGAAGGNRTRDIQLGKLTLVQRR